MIDYGLNHTDTGQRADIDGTVHDDIDSSTGYWDDGTPLPPDLGSTAEQTYEREVVRVLAHLRVNAEAKRRFVAEQAQSAKPVPEFVSLTDLLNEPDRAVSYRIDGLLPTDGRAILAAQFKAGKTTMVGNLIRCLVDGAPFLSQYEAAPVTGRVALVDTEMGRDKLRDWLKDQCIARPDKVELNALRGQLSTFDLLNDACLDAWADKLRAKDTEFLILDCLRPILDSLGLDESHDAGRVLVALDELAQRAGVSEMLIVHHMGHSGERSRGDSRLRDWPDVEWRLVRENTDEPASRRFFSAYGRDVEVAESALDYDPITRHLVIAGGSRRSSKADALVPDIVALLADQPGLSGRAIERTLTEAGLSRDTVRDAIKLGVEDGRIRTSPGQHNSTLHWVSCARGDQHHPRAEPTTSENASAHSSKMIKADRASAQEDHKDVSTGQEVSARVRASARPVRGRTASERASAYIRSTRALTGAHTDPDQIDHRVLTHLTHTPRPVGVIAGEVRADPVDVQAALDRLTSAGKVVRHPPNDPGPPTWSLPDCGQQRPTCGEDVRQNGLDETRVIGALSFVSPEKETPVSKVGKVPMKKYDKVREKELKVRAKRQGLMLHKSVDATSGYVSWYLVDRASQKYLGWDNTAKAGSLDLDGVDRTLTWHYSACPPLPLGV